ncbi:hypothetical protein CTA1_618 [Colletotrichum tanaceti]|uniref:Uncharacterized protein n=1 Tax=Colletotrichum tanaceti TaxID=1306861 RepID=A0A4U6XSS2_9PEZI|nr:hypothetical protein CTA1_618 [Colletotrichum tanaceti]
MSASEQLDIVSPGDEKNRDRGLSLDLVLPRLRPWEAAARRQMAQPPDSNQLAACPPASPLTNIIVLHGARGHGLLRPARA